MCSCKGKGATVLPPARGGIAALPAQVVTTLDQLALSEPVVTRTTRLVERQLEQLGPQYFTFRFER